MYDPINLPKLPSKRKLNLQANMGKGLTALSGAANLATQWSAMNSEADSINTNTPELTKDSYGRPEYNLGQSIDNATSIDPQGASGGEIANGALTGASAGAALGPIGAGVGALIGGIGTAIFGDSRKTEMEKKRRLAVANLRSAQMQYNRANSQFNLQQVGNSQYNDILNMTARQNNLYNYNSPLQ